MKSKVMAPMAAICVMGAAASVTAAATASTPTHAGSPHASQSRTGRHTGTGVPGVHKPPTNGSQALTDLKVIVNDSATLKGMTRREPTFAFNFGTYLRYTRKLNAESRSSAAHSTFQQALYDADGFEAIVGIAFSDGTGARRHINRHELGLWGVPKGSKKFVRLRCKVADHAGGLAIRPRTPARNIRLETYAGALTEPAKDTSPHTVSVYIDISRGETVNDHLVVKKHV